MRGTTHSADHSTILAAALIACLAVLGGLVPGVPAAARLPLVQIPSLARPGVSLPGILEMLENGLPGCEVVRARLIGEEGAELNALRTAYPKSHIVRTAPSRAAETVLVCPR
jgi:hypothetical protein